MRDFAERRIERFAKITDVVRELFKGHDEEAEEALTIAKSMLSTARGEAIAKSSDLPMDSQFSDVFAIPREPGIRRPELTREVTAGNLWLHPLPIQKSDRTFSDGFDDGWFEDMGRVAVAKSSSEDAPLGKGECSSRMHKLHARIRPMASDVENQQMQKAIDCLDFALFAQLAEQVLEREVDEVDEVD